MKSVNLTLNTIDKVKVFVNQITKFDGDFDLSSDRYVVDAKSIMGIFSLDLGKPLQLDVHDEGQYEKVCEEFKDFIVS